MPAFMALIVTFIELLLEHELAWGVFRQLRGPNIYTFLTTYPPLSGQLWTIVDNCGQLWTFYIKPILLFT